MTNTYTYKPTIRAIQYTGDFNKVFDFIGGNVTRFEWINNDLQSHINIKTDNGVAVSTLRLGDYLVKETFADGKIEYKTMDEDELKKYYKEVDTPKSLEQAVCDTTESAADTTPCEDEPEQGGRAEIGEIYWYINKNGMVKCHVERGNERDKQRYEYGNYFHTEEEALQARDEWLLQLKYRQWRRQHDPVALDWGNRKQRKWDIVYDYTISEPLHFYNSVHHTFGSFYFSTREFAERFCNENKDLIHRVLGVQ